MDIAYNGSEYSGWQIQPNAVTVQEKMEAAISKVTSEEAKVVGCGRTDAGVHARLFTLHVDLANEPNEQFVFRLRNFIFYLHYVL